MSLSDAPTLRIVLEPTNDISSARRLELVEALLGSGHVVTSPAGNEDFAGARPDDNLLFLREGSPPSEHDGDDNRRCHDISGLDAGAVLDLVTEAQKETSAYSSGAWKPWFPVIDYDRCTDCMQCLSFCLFDVYGVDSEKHIEVRNNEKCKTNCPACSRVCPEVAILFPKYGSGPINGDMVQQEDVDREKMKIDVSALLGGDIYSMLRERHQRADTRFSKERDESRALKERMKCLKKLGEQFDIPPEVLDSLPSLGEIQSRAAEAYEKHLGKKKGNNDTIGRLET